jgi:hypothetical protein
VLTLCLAIMTSSAAVPVQAHASGGACDFEGPGDGDPGAWGITQGPKALLCGIAGIFSGGNKLLFGAAELLWEGVYGAGCGLNNLRTWNGNSCETSVADAGSNARNFLNDWADCIAAFDPTPYGVLGRFVTAEDVFDANQSLDASVSSIASSGGQEAVQSFIRSPGVEDAVARNPQLKKALGRAVPGLSVALIIPAAASECFSVTVENLSAVERADEDIAGSCESRFGRSRGGNRAEQIAQCEESRLMGRYVTDDNISACLAGRSIATGWNETTTRGGHGARINGPSTTTTWDGVEFTPEEQRDLCAKIILPQARDRGLIDGDDLDVANTLAPAAPPSVQALMPSAVPGGSTADSCGVVLRAIADGSAGSFNAARRSECTGTTDGDCQKYRAMAAVGEPQTFSNRSVAEDTQRRCM